MRKVLLGNLIFKQKSTCKKPVPWKKEQAEAYVKGREMRETDTENMLEDSFYWSSQNREKDLNGHLRILF